MNIDKVMKGDRRNTFKYSKYSFDALMLVTVFIIISFANSGVLIARGLLYIVFIGSIIFFPIIQRKLLLIHSKIVRSAFILVIFNILVMLYNYEGFTSLYNGLLYSGSVMFFIVLINSKFKLELLELFVRYMAIISKILFMFMIYHLLISKTFVWVSGTSFLFLFLYFIYLDEKTHKFSKMLFTLFWLIIAILDEARTFILLFPIFILLILTWKSIIKSKMRYNNLFLISSILLFVIPILYILLSQSVYAQILNEYALKYTHSRFFSGRDVIWSRLIDYYLKNNLFFGGGHHISPNYVYGISISSHNTYISILTRTGIVGSLLFISFIKNIWSRYYCYQDIQAVKYSAIFFIITLLKQSSELSLISNNIALSVVNWLVIAFGLIYVNSINIKKNIKKRGRL